MNMDSSIPAGNLNDLWEYTMATKEWNWISGPNIIDETENYGTKGIPGASVVPGRRHSTKCAVDPVSGDLFLFGGCDYNGKFNDVFRYSFSTSVWTRVSGPILPMIPARLARWASPTPTMHRPV
jgi:hypothetical protein